MWPDRVSKPGPLAHQSDALRTVLRGPTWKGVEQSDVKHLIR